MTVETCPDRETLERLLSGRLGGPIAEQLEQHLLQCAACASVADTLTAGDDWTAAIRARREIAGEEEIIARVIDDCQSLGSRISADPSRETVSLGGRGADRPEDTPTEAGPVSASPGAAASVHQDEYYFLAPAEQPDEIGRLGGYRVLEVLGAGGMGVVFRAEDPRLKRQIALKAMKPAIAASRSAKDRFLREAQATAAIEHDNIVTIHQVGEDRGVPFIAMQFLRGESLQTRLRREGRLDQREVLRIGREVAAGLAAAHARGLIHRDIKPDNIWLDVASGRAKILDFGLARATADDASLTQSGTVLGTPRYMAPEQAQGEAVDHRCDLFSLGCVLYHLAAGRAPFVGANVTATLMAVVYQNPEPIEKVCPGIEPDLAALIRRLLAKDRDARPATAEDVASTLAAMEGHASVAAAEPTVTFSSTIARPKPTRHPVVFGAAIAVLAAAVLIALWAAGVIFKVETNDGTLVVKATGDDFATTVQGKTVEIRNTRTGESFKVPLDQTETARPNLKPGEYQFVLDTSSGLHTKTDRFTIANGGQSEVEVWWEPPAPAPIAETGVSAYQPGQPWHGWPADAPRPAIAPYDAAQAAEHQQMWADYLGVPIEYTNSSGMKFRLIPPGEFVMGGTPADIAVARQQADPGEHWQDVATSEGPQHRVILTQAFYLATHEVTQEQFMRVMGANPSYFSASGGGKDQLAGQATEQLPVDSVSWNEAAEFCAKLSELEGVPPGYVQNEARFETSGGDGYRLPTEAEWEYAYRAGTTSRYWTGDADEGLVPNAWVVTNSAGRTHPVGELPPNPFGLCDMAGNVWEWVQDGWERTYYEQFTTAPAIDPTGPITPAHRRVLRGGRWQSIPFSCRASGRLTNGVNRRDYRAGFRVALSVEAVRRTVRPAAAEVRPWPPNPPPPAVAPFDAAQAAAHQQAWADYLDVPVEYTNSLGMIFRLIPPGEFLMGSPDAEIQEALQAAMDAPWRDSIVSEAPQRRVTLTRPTYLCAHEVTQREYQAIMGENPSHFAATGAGAGNIGGADTSNCPVEYVNWHKAVMFCSKLSQRERFALKTPMDRDAEQSYHLPTAALWQFACRAGTTGKFWNGESAADATKIAWCAENSEDHTHPVGDLPANPFGLFDMHGNVLEWCHDAWTPTYYQELGEGPIIDPTGPTGSLIRVRHGGGWGQPISFHRSACRRVGKSIYADHMIGFRVALSVEAVRRAVQPVEAAGWHGWPADAPPPAIAPFDAAQAAAHQDAWADYLNVPVEYANTIGMKFRLVPPGEFLMGSTPEEIEGGMPSVGQDAQQREYIRSEGPKHRVILTQPFYLGIHEVAQADYAAVRGINPAHHANQAPGQHAVEGLDTARHAVEWVTWREASDFCARLSEREFPDNKDPANVKHAAMHYRLPTEAEWEFACRAGTATVYCLGDDYANLEQMAWIGDNSGGRTHAGGELEANPLGLYDMPGNVWEWCADVWTSSYFTRFANQPAVDPLGPSVASPLRIIRGGSCNNPKSLGYGRSSARSAFDSLNRSPHLGFRVALSVDSVRAAIDGRAPLQ
jgi:formylglycine-generating enzyme required for sulfatase activity